MISDARKAKGWTQGRLALAAGTTQSRVAELEGSGGNPTMGTIAQVASVLGLEIVLAPKRPRKRHAPAAVRERSPRYEANPRIIILAGPNGAGKSTFAQEYLPHEAACGVFVNADLIAAGLAPFAPQTAAVRAGRLMLEEIRRHASRGVTFAFESTLAGRGYARLVPEWQASGYRVELVFLSLANVDLAIARVATRVAQGGHDIPEQVIRRRFSQGLHNFTNVYRPLVNGWQLYDNSAAVPKLIEQS
jgi:predicted ABC-type ATPase